MAALTEHGTAYNGYAFTLWTDYKAGTTLASYDPETGVAMLSRDALDPDETGIMLEVVGRGEEDRVRTLLRAAGHTIIGLG